MKIADYLLQVHCGCCLETFFVFWVDSEIVIPILIFYFLAGEEGEE